jgi:DNA repair exonuclease SbcCD ATPase subunit
MSDSPASLESQLQEALAARAGSLRELDSLRNRIASAEEIHRKAHQRESEHQRTSDALAAAELNLKAARIAEAQALSRATAAEAALARTGQSASAGDPDATAALERQLGEARRREDALAAEVAELRSKLEAARAQVTAVASDEVLAALRDTAGRATAELHAVNAQNAALRRDLDAARARTQQLEAAAVTIQARLSGPPPELAAALAELEKARHATRSAEGNNNRLRRELDTAKTRIAGLETTLAAARQASVLTQSVTADLAAARKQVEQLREELRRLKKGPAPANRPNDRGPRPPRDQERAPAAAPAAMAPMEAQKPEAQAVEVPAPAAAAPDAAAPEQTADPEAKQDT